MSGYIDLHLHYVPNVDDGVKSYEEGVAICQGLARIGYARVVSTPHIRAHMFPNTKSKLKEAFDAFAARAVNEPNMPALGLGAEHFCDESFWGLLADDGLLPYPGGFAALIEFPPEAVSIGGLADRFFKMQLKGLRPVIAHPERYNQLHKKTDPLDPLLDVGLVAQLDLMSLVGKYGRAPQKAAERMVEEGVYYLASTDCHKPSDVEYVVDAIARLKKLVGIDEAEELLCTNPLSILEGNIDP